MRTVMNRRAARDRAKRELAGQQLLCPNLDADWMNGDSWRVLRTMGEFADNLESLVDTDKKAVTVFGSAQVRPGSEFYQLGEEVGKASAEAGYAVIIGEGSGLMKAASKGAHESGGFSIGLGIELPYERGMNQYVDLGVEFRYFFVRKTMFVEYAQAFAVLPGGLGTLDGLFEAITLVQTHKIRQFPIVLVGKDYWDGSLRRVRDGLVAQGTADPEETGIIRVVDTAARAQQIVAKNTVHLD